MSDKMDAVVADLTAAQHSMDSVQSALVEFQAACIVGDEPESKIARDKALGALDSFMDHIAAANMAADFRRA